MTHWSLREVAVLSLCALPVMLGCPPTPLASACENDLDCPGQTQCDVDSGLCRSRDASPGDAARADTTVVDTAIADGSPPDMALQDSGNPVDSAGPGDTDIPDTAMSDLSAGDLNSSVDHSSADLPQGVDGTQGDALDRDRDAAVPADAQPMPDHSGEDLGPCGLCPAQTPHCAPGNTCVECISSSHCDGRDCDPQTHRCPRPDAAG